MDDEELVEAISAASRALVGLAARSIAETGVDLTLPQYRALVVLATRGPQRMSALAAHLGLSPSSTTRLVERLERKDFAARRPSLESRREVAVEATADGQRQIDEVMEHRKRAIAAALEPIDRPTREAMLVAFQTFAQATGEPVIQPSTPS